MHEMSLCLSMIDLVSDRVRAEGACRVLRVGVTIGALGHVEAEALAFCFESAAQGTVAAGATLDIRVVPGRAFCFDCGQSVALARRGDPCGLCGGGTLRIDDGQQMQVSEIEIV
jgi:hydrogenase nickel incorporation protein HypA/HybF